MNRIIYLDTSSTAIPFIHVSDYNYNWFNPNNHYAIDEILEFTKCEEEVKESIGAKSGKVIFGGNASWFFEKLYNNYRDFWFCGFYEHDCVYKNGIEINFNEIETCDDEIYCHQFVNNVTGEIFPVEEIGKIIKDENGYFICDATAGIGKAIIPDSIDEWCDVFVSSSHKLNVDNKQIGFAWISDRFANWFFSEKSVVNGYGFVDGTPDLACAKATTEAVSIACNNVKEYNRHYNNLAYYLEIQLNKNNIRHNYVHREKYTSAINAIVLNDIKADALCNYLAAVHNVYISPGHSACEENSDYRVLKEYGLTQEECESTIRVSFGHNTTKEDIDYLVNGIVEFKKEFMND